MKQLAIGLVIGAVAMAMLAPKSTGLANFIASPAAAEPGGKCSAQEEARNRALVSTFKPGAKSLYASMAPDYLQHNEEYIRFGELNGISGRKVVETMDQMRLGITGARRKPPVPGQPPINFFYKVLVDCDYAIQVVQAWHPNPLEPGKFYATYMFNMWRIENGMLKEHWDPDGLPDPIPDFLKVPLKDLKPVNGDAGAPKS